jgi:hypothetical protein
VILDALLVGLVHDADHDVAEDTELEEVAQLYTQIESLQNVLLTYVKDQSHTLETMGEKGRQIVVEMIVHVLQVVFKI